MAAAGNEIAELSPEETARVQALGEEVVAEWIEEVGRQGLDGAGLVADVRAMVDDATK